MSPATSAGTRIAFFGGSFDPPHLAHIAVARAAQEALHLDRVLFAPVGLQPLKPAGSSASFADRVAMTRLAIAGQPGFEVSEADAPNPETPNPQQTLNYTPNYTVDTLTRLRNSLPSSIELYLLLGADSFRTLHHWRRAAELPFLANLIVASRPNPKSGPESNSLASPSDIARCLPPGIAVHLLPGQPNQYRLTNSSRAESLLTILPNLHYDISATQLRNQILGRFSNQSPAIAPAVLEYIRQHGLYTKPNPTKPQKNQ